MGNRVREEGQEAVVGGNAVVKIGFAWGKSEEWKVWCDENFGFW